MIKFIAVSFFMYFCEVYLTRPFYCIKRLPNYLFGHYKISHRNYHLKGEKKAKLSVQIVNFRKKKKKEKKSKLGVNLICKS